MVLGDLVSGTVQCIDHWSPDLPEGDHLTFPGEKAWLRYLCNTAMYTSSPQIITTCWHEFVMSLCISLGSVCSKVCVFNELPATILTWNSSYVHTHLLELGVSMLGYVWLRICFPKLQHCLARALQCCHVRASPGYSIEDWNRKQHWRGGRGKWRFQISTLKGRRDKLLRNQ